MRNLTAGSRCKPQIKDKEEKDYKKKPFRGRSKKTDKEVANGRKLHFMRRRR